MSAPSEPEAIEAQRAREEGRLLGYAQGLADARAGCFEAIDVMSAGAAEREGDLRIEIAQLREDLERLQG